MEENKIFETSDIALAAYLLMKERKILKLTDNNGNGKYSFIFDNNNNRVEELKINYANSESRRFDGSMRIIKMMIKSKG